MIYLFDTNMAIYAMKKHPNVIARLKTTSPDDLAISAMSVAEMRFGACKSRNPEQTQLELDRFLAPWNLVPFDEAAASHYGRLRFHLAQAGLPIGERDMIIASIALSRGMAVATNDSDYQRVPELRIENWTE